jgi:hypothetical protein
MFAHPLIISKEIRSPSWVRLSGDQATTVVVLGPALIAPLNNHAAATSLTLLVIALVICIKKRPVRCRPGSTSVGTCIDCWLRMRWRNSGPDLYEACAPSALTKMSLGRGAYGLLARNSNALRRCSQTFCWLSMGLRPR